MSGRLFEVVKAAGDQRGCRRADKRRKLIGRGEIEAPKAPTFREGSRLNPYVDPVSSSDDDEDFDSSDASAPAPRRRRSSGGKKVSRRRNSQRNRNSGRHLRSDSRSGRILSPLPPNATASYKSNVPLDLDFVSMVKAENGRTTLNGRKVAKPRSTGRNAINAAEMVKRRRVGMGDHAGRARDGIREFGRGLRGAFQKAFARDVDSRGTKRKRGEIVKVMQPPDSRAGDDAETVALEDTEVEDDGSVVESEAATEVSAAEAESVADMSVDGDVQDEDGPDHSDEESDANDDSFFLFQASQPQLSRLRRDRLVELAKLVLDGEDEEAEEQVEASTKDNLIKRVIDARPPNGSQGSSGSQRRAYRGQPSSPLSEATSVPASIAPSSERDSDGSDDSELERPRARRRVTTDNLTPRRKLHMRTRSTSSRTSGASSPEVSRVRRNRISLPHLSALSLGSDRSLDDIPRLRRSTRSSRNSIDMSKSLSESLGRRQTRSSALLVEEEEDEKESANNEDVTPKIARRLTRAANGLRPRPPKRRVTFDSQSSALGGSSAGSLIDDGEKDESAANSEEDEDVEMRDEGGGPTPVARRTRTSNKMRDELKARSDAFAPRITRSQSKTSQSSAFASDDEEGILVPPRRSTRSQAATKKPLQLATPPSEEDEEADEEDQDEEADEEGEDDEGVVEVVRSEQRSARKLRSGKLLRRLDSPLKEADEDGEDEAEEDEEEEDELESAIDVDEAMVDGDDDDDEGESVEMASASELSDEEAEEEDSTESVDLASVTPATLLRLRRDKLVGLCEERDLPSEGTKKELAQALLEWRDSAEEGDIFFVPPSEASASESDSDADSAASAGTVHGDAGAVRAVRKVARTIPSDCPTPLLLQSGHTEASDKPKTPTSQTSSSMQSEAAEIDLESLNLQDREIAPKDLQRLERIGSGGFKDVYRGVYKKLPVAIADIRGHLTEMDLKELRILRDLRHENIVRFIGVSVPEDSKNVPVMIVTEICTNGDLFDYVRNAPAPPFEKVLSIMRDIARGLDYLHTRKPAIIHRDLKSSNVLITARGVAKLNDFGLARIKTSTRSMIRSLVGTVNWQAPELWVAHPRYNEKVDVYSAGMVYWEMLQWHQPVKRYPFEGQNEHAIYHDAGQRQLRPATAGMRRQWGDGILDLIEQLWAQSPADRPSMSECIVELDQLKAVNKKPRSK